MKAAYWTALGAMLIPLGVSFMALWPSLSNIAFWMMIIGSVCFVAGWGYTIRDEHRNTLREIEAAKQRHLDNNKREEEHVEYLATLRVIAQRLGAGSELTRRKATREVERFKEKREGKDD